MWLLKRRAALSAAFKHRAGIAVADNGQ